MHLHKYEKIWLVFGFGMLCTFLVILGVNAFAMNKMPPSDLRTLDVSKLDETPPFDKPGLVKIDDNEYDLNMIAYTFSYTPAETVIPVGATVHFNVTSRDVIHGFAIPETNVNMMVIPGYVNNVTHTFTKPGTYLILCNEYCGGAHHLMMAHIVVK